jgi:hypothetical protein
MDSTHRTARLAGFLYLVMAILMFFGYMFIPARFSGDAATMARKIVEDALTYRITILMALVAQILFVFVVLNLYELFRGVDRKLARLMVTLVCIGIACDFVHLALRMAPLALLTDKDALPAFSSAQTVELSLTSFSVGANLGKLATSIWGLWLFPFGMLVIRSRWFPRLLGVLLMVTGAAYVATSFTGIVFPDQLPLVSRVAMPLYFGELPIVFWMLLFGTQRVAKAMPASFAQVAAE